jgi:hypothetical protein
LAEAFVHRHVVVDDNDGWADAPGGASIVAVVVRFRRGERGGRFM